MCPLDVYPCQFTVRMVLYFIPSSEFNAYLKQIKVLLSAVKKISYFFTSDGYDLYYFTVVNRSCLDNVGLNFFQKRS